MGTTNRRRDEEEGIMTDIQTQKAFQRQEKITVASQIAASKTNKKRASRYHKSVGLGFKTPKAAIEGNYVDKKCPFTSNVSVPRPHLEGRRVLDQDGTHDHVPSGLPPLHQEVQAF